MSVIAFPTKRKALAVVPTSAERSSHMTTAASVQSLAQSYTLEELQWQIREKHLPLQPITIGYGPFDHNPDDCQPCPLCGEGFDAAHNTSSLGYGVWASGVKAFLRFHVLCVRSVERGEPIARPDPDICDYCAERVPESRRGTHGYDDHNFTPSGAAVAVRTFLTKQAMCYGCGHTTHAPGSQCGATTYFTKQPCRCPGYDEGDLA